MIPSITSLEKRVIILAPTGDDGSAAKFVLDQSEIPSTVVETLERLVHEIQRGAAVVLVAEEGLTAKETHLLTELLSCQPYWSDLPLFIVTSTSEETLGGQRILDLFFSKTNVTLLERPLRPLTLVTALRSGLRARFKQYEMRNYLEEKNFLIERAQSAVHTREQFLSIASHELRTPLTSILLRLEMAKKEWGTQKPGPRNSEKLERFLESSHTQLKRLTSLVNDLFDVARIQNGKMVLDYKWGDLAKMVAQCIDQLQDALSQSKCRIQTELRTAVEGYWDTSRMEQVLVNLISNAARHAPESEILVSLHQVESTAVLTVRDNGPGIPPANQQRIFDRFDRGSSSKNTGGLGLGLFIVKEIIQAHRGEVRVESKPGQGASFILEIPIRKTKATHE